MGTDSVDEHKPGAAATTINGRPAREDKKSTTTLVERARVPIVARDKMPRHSHQSRTVCQKQRETTRALCNREACKIRDGRVGPSGDSQRT